MFLTYSDYLEHRESQLVECECCKEEMEDRDTVLTEAKEVICERCIDEATQVSSCCGCSFIGESRRCSGCKENASTSYELW